MERGRSPSVRKKLEDVHAPIKRLLVGRAMRSDRLGETLLPKWIALPVFCSDPLSSVAYATEEIRAGCAVGRRDHGGSWKVVTR